MPTAVEVLAEASARTGLSDVGDDSFREGLEILLASLQDEARLHVHGQVNAPTRSTRSSATNAERHLT